MAGCMHDTEQLVGPIILARMMELKLATYKAL